MMDKTFVLERACLPSVFFTATSPFSDLPPEVLLQLADAARVDFCPVGTRLYSIGQRVEDLLLIQSGGVCVSRPGGACAPCGVDYLGSGQAVGAAELLRGESASCDATALADTFYFRLEGEIFLQAARESPALAAYFCDRFPKDYLERALTLLRRDRGGGGAGFRPIFALTVGEVAHAPVVDIPGEASIVAAAARMADFGVGSILLRDEGGRVAGIVTDRDFRYKVLARGGDMTRPVREIMSSPVCVVDHREACFGALTVMMQRRVHHLAVERDGAVIGMVTSHDILALQGRSPFSLFADIEASRDVSSLAGLCERIPRTARALLEDGAGAAHVGRMLTMVWDAVLERVLTLIQGELGPPPAPFCWLALGDAGRMEQVPGEPPDGVVVYQDPPGEEAVRCRDYFAGFARMALAHVRTICHDPETRGGFSGSRSLAFAEWAAFFSGHAADDRPESAALAFALCEARPVFGFLDLGKRLCRLIRERAGRDAHVLARFSRTLFPEHPPLAIYAGQVVDASGKGERHFDVKALGLAPLAGFVALFCLAHGLPGVHTLSRLAALRDSGRLDPEACGRIATAVDFLMHLRLAHRLGQARVGRQPKEMDDQVVAADLDPLVVRMLKDVFAAVAQAQALLAERSGLNREGT
ncbi:putative nucleotidyltransferase substrate binding domain-containing protein [Desulfolutivibrio sp.]|uniref:putative nucleotidyltransferase substrate binding domain-containing protein n=1 Tax=Desulfolutivibrio sp. TaxID=2773296 RepID=UPI002F96E83E